MNEDTTAVRPGEELNTDNLRAYLQAELDLQNAAIEILQFPSGNSNLTYSVRIGADEYVLRRPPFGNQVKSAHDMAREFNVLSKLDAAYAPAPKPLLYCADEAVIGAEFYLMERRHGLVIRGRAPAALETSPALRRAVCESFIGNLALLHALDYERIGLGELGRPEGYARRQTEGWTKRYFNAQTDDHPALAEVIEWLAENVPAAGGAALIHNDYKFDNVMLDPADLTRIVAVLDWEMTTIGEPLMDLGSSLAYWMAPDAGPEMLAMPFNPRVLMENVTRAELVRMYEEKSGRAVTDLLFYYVFGTFKLAVIAQQIYFRYVRGFTQDRRFASFNVFIGNLGRIAAAALDSGTV
ncbi:MAG: phosphotransferase family protein [Acidobacteria bacterium]|nr:phosphotransferase family protein [Acidobacteriota bacterium]